MSEHPPPLVLVLIDRDSRLSIMQTGEAMIGFVDERQAIADVVWLPRENRWAEIRERAGDKAIISLGNDVIETALNTVRRLAGGEVVVAEVRGFGR